MFLFPILQWGIVDINFSRMEKETLSIAMMYTPVKVTVAEDQMAK